MIPHVLALCALLTRVILKALTLQKCVHVCYMFICEKSFGMCNYLCCYDRV